MIKFIIGLLFVFLTINQSVAQDLTIAVKSSDKNENRRKIDEETRTIFKNEILETKELLNNIHSKDYRAVYNAFKVTFSNSSWSYAYTKEEVNWASELIDKYGLPPIDSVTIRTSHPISWIKENSPDAFGHTITFDYDFVNDGEELHNSISVTYINRDDSHSGERLGDYNLFSVIFHKTEALSKSLNYLLNFDEDDFAHTLDSALKCDKNIVEKLELKKEEFELFSKNYIDYFPNLYELRVDYLELEALPIFIGNMNNLKVLIASNNRLTSLPNWICNLGRLEHLDVGYNVISSVPVCLKQSDSLKELELQRNSIPEKDVSKINKWFKNIDLNISLQE